jgi:hypothetical protein
MLEAPPIFIGGSIAMMLHSYRIYKASAEKAKRQIKP